MKRTSTIAMLAMLGCLVLFTGCEKQVNLTFVNTTDQTLSLQLTSPEEGTQTLGVVTPTGGKLKYELKIKNDDLPATCTWQAGDISDQFTVTKNSPGKLWVDIVPGGSRVRDKKTAVSETHQSEQKRKVSQETVVE